MIALGIDSGPLVAPCWDRKSDQIGPKRVPKLIKKVIEKHAEFGIDFFYEFWIILDPNLGGQGGPTNQSFGVKSAPGATLGHKWPPGPIQARFLVDLGRFFVDVGSILGRFWGRCWSLFVWLLMDNVTNLTNLTNLT